MDAAARPPALSGRQRKAHSSHKTQGWRPPNPASASAPPRAPLAPHSSQPQTRGLQTYDKDVQTALRYKNPLTRLLVEKFSPGAPEFQPIRVFNIPCISDSGVTYSSPNPLPHRSTAGPERARPAQGLRTRPALPSREASTGAPQPPSPRPALNPLPGRRSARLRQHGMGRVGLEHSTQRQPSLVSSCLKLPVPG